MDADDAVWRRALASTTRFCFDTVDEQTHLAAYSSVSPLGSQLARLDSPTMYNRITHHHTSLFDAPPPRLMLLTVYLKCCADGGGDRLVVTAERRTVFSALFSRRHIRGDASCTVFMFV